MPLLPVYSTNGQGRREIIIPSRSAMRQFGAVQIVNNVGQRQESDWAAIRASIAAGHVVIVLSAYETDVLPMFLTGKLAYGGNVRFDCRKPKSWNLVQTDEAYAELQPLEFQCPHCHELFDSAFKLGGHVQRAHREIAERERALSA